MSGSVPPQPTRPDLRAIVVQIDLADSWYRALAEFGGKLAGLLGNTRLRSDPHAVSSLDDLLGAVYSLILARHQQFDDRTNQPIEIDVVQKRAAQVQQGDVRIDGKWMAGWHFNSALFRIAAVYHRLLKLTVGQPTTTDNVPTLLPKVQALYQQWRKTRWSSDRVHAIHTEVNTLKHTPQGVHFGRTVTFEGAIASIAELLDLVEAWSSRTP